MTTWLEQLKPASFRGVGFHVDTIDLTAGDNVVLREYPFAELPMVFRMGGGAEEIKFAAYVIGDDYIDKRDALLRVLTGEGVLIHPTAGAMRVFYGGKYRVSEAPTSAGGMARLELVFIRAETRIYPTAGTSTAATVASDAAAVAEAVQAEFAQQWVVSGQPGWVADSALARLKDTLGGAWDKIVAASKVPGDFNTSLLANYAVIRDGLDELVGVPRRLASSVSMLFKLPGEMTQAAARDWRAAFQWAAEAGSNTVTPAFEAVVMPEPGQGLVMYGTGTAQAPQSAGRVALARLHAAGDGLIEGLALAAWAQAASQIELTSYDEAVTMRAWAHAQFRRRLHAMSELPASLAMPESDSYTALLTLYTSTLADLQARSRDAVRLESDVPKQWEPVWLTSYRLYGTADWADEILSMNPHIRHPLLVPPGRALRVVRHD